MAGVLLAIWEALRMAFSWNETTFLNLEPLVLAGDVGWRFITTGGVDILRAMESAPPPEHEMVHDHHGHDDH